MIIKLFSKQIATEAEGRPWSIETSSARNHKPFVVSTPHLSTSASYPRMSSEKSSSNYGGYSGGSGGYQDAPSLSRYLFSEQKRLIHRFIASIPGPYILTLFSELILT